MTGYIRQKDSPENSFLIAEVLKAQRALQTFVYDPRTQQLDSVLAGPRSRGFFKRFHSVTSPLLSITLGTLKYVPSVSGAFIIACSCVRQGFTSSARIAYSNFAAPSRSLAARVATCAIGGTSLVSSWPSMSM